MSDITVKIKGDASGFQKEWKKVQGNISNTLTGGGMGVSGMVGGVLGGLSLGALTSQIKSLVDELDNIGDSAKKLGLTTDEFQLLDYAAKKVGASGEDVGRAFKKLNSIIYGAVHGEKEAAAALYYLGLNADELMKKSKPEQLTAVAKALDGITNATENAALANILFGKTSQLTVQALKELPQAQREFEAFNQGFSKRNIDSAESISDAWLRFTRTLKKGIVDTGTLQGLDSIIKAAEGYLLILNKIEKAVNVNQERAFKIIPEIIKVASPGYRMISGAVDGMAEIRDTIMKDPSGGSMFKDQGAADAAKSIGGSIASVIPGGGAMFTGIDVFTKIYSVLDARLPGGTSTGEIVK